MTANLDTLFERSIRTHSDTNPDGDNMKARHRYHAPFISGGEVMLAKITVNEFKEESDGTRIYSVEAMEIVKPAIFKASSISEDRRNYNRVAGFEEKLESRIAEVNNQPSVESSFSIGRATVTPTTSTQTFPTKDGGVIGPASFSIAAYHGTPHKVDKFTTEKIGTGEGAQAYGWGLYFAHSQKVAEQYQNELGAGVEIDGQKARQLPIGGNRAATPNDVAETALAGAHRIGETSESIAARAILDIQSSKRSPRYQDTESQTKFATAISLIEQWTQAGSIAVKTGNLYTVTLKVEEEDLLDWDEPITGQSVWDELYYKAQDEQSEIGDEVILDPGEDESGLNGRAILEKLAHAYGETAGAAAKGASKYLAKRGVKGIRYLDGNSRADGQGSYNYVIFDEADIEITEENGQPVSLSPSSFSIGTRRVMPTNYPESAREIISTTNVKGITHALLKPGEQLVILDEEAEKPMMVSPAYKAAKREGDKRAAWDIARLFLTGKRVAPYKAALGDRSPVFVPIRQEEGAKQNLLPIAAAWALQQQLGGRVANTVLQLKKGGLTGADNNERSKKDHDFEGALEIQPGETVVLIDDTFTSGSTLTSLYDHLSAQGIEAEHIFSIASGRYTKNIAASDEQITRALDKVGMSEEEFQRATGIPIQAFTGAELAAYSLNGARGIEGFALRFDVKGNTGSGSMVPGSDAGLDPSFSLGGMKAANWTK